MAKEDMKMDKMQDKKMAKKAIGMHDKQMHGGKKTDMSALKKGGVSGKHMMPNGKMMKDSAMPKMAKGGCAKMAKGGGIESKGKTKGRIC